MTRSGIEGAGKRAMGKLQSQLRRDLARIVLFRAFGDPAPRSKHPFLGFI